MKVVKCKQGSVEWVRARLGLPTSSEFDRILTPKTLKPSGGQAKYLARLTAEWYLQTPLEDYTSGFMARGTQLESEAVAWFEFQTGLNAETVGLCVRDDGAAGASPDRLVGDDGVLEIKCPSAETQMGYVLHGMDEYTLQIQGQLWVTGRKYVYLLAYHPSIPSVLNRYERDERVISAIEREVLGFACDMEAARTKVKELAHANLDAREQFRDDDNPF